MEREKCKQCSNKFFKATNPDVCRACEELLFNDVREFVRDNDVATMSEIMNEFDVSKKLIEKWIKHGRLEFTKGELGQMFEKYNEARSSIKEMSRSEKLKENLKKQLEAEERKSKGGFHSKG